jgi:hypothetical protein
MLKSHFSTNSKAYNVFDEEEISPGFRLEYKSKWKKIRCSAIFLALTTDISQRRMLRRCTATRSHPRPKARSFLLDFHYFILKNCQIHKAYFYLEIIHSPKKTHHQSSIQEGPAETEPERAQASLLDTSRVGGMGAELPDMASSKYSEIESYVTDKDHCKKFPPSGLSVLVMNYLNLFDIPIFKHL